MRFRLSVRSLVVTASFFLPSVSSAQVPTTKPTPAEAQVLLKTRPDLVAQLRQRFATSGLTRDQVHARLRAEGYPEDLLDSYLPGASGDVAPLTDDVFRAVRALGVSDSTDIALLQGLTAGPPAGAGRSANAPAVKDTVEIARSLADSGFTIFGLDVFRGSTSQFDPNLAGPVDANYRLGPGDKLVLILTGDVEASYQLDVTREGFVVIPQVGQIYVANLTLGQVDQLLAARLSRVYSGISRNNQGTTRFSISVARLRANQIYVVGDVQRPGSYTVSSTGTALTALYAAGGPTINGSLRRIEIRRGGRVVDALDVYDYLIRGDASHDIRLETGDVVFIPVHGIRARIVGEVARPATYELKPGETLADLVRDAGNFRASASRQRVLIERIVPAEQRRESGRDRITIDVASESLLAGAGIGLQDGDVVRVFPISERVRNRVIVQGNVYQPGVVALTTGMRLSDALRKAGGVLPNTYLGEMLVSRLRSDGKREQLRSMLADTLGRVIDDVLLQEEDELTVFSLSTFRPDRYVAIGGAVKSGGRFPFREGMTMRDLVLLAGGVLESAYLREAEIARLPVSRDSGRTAITIRVPLDSTYLFDRGPRGEYLGPPGLQVTSSGAPEVPLKPYDNVLILRQPGWELQRTVVIQGEVRFPGAYALVTKSERLSDLVQRAGGLTDEAYIDGIVFARGQGGLGRVGLDLSSALRNYESSDNLILRDADVITVPPFSSIVSVRGAVNQPANLAYVRGKGIDYYIDAAGGPAKNADESHAYVVQPSGKLETVRNHFLRPSSMPKPRPGAVVTVPEQDPADKKDIVALITQIGQITAALATVIILSKK